MRMAHDVICPNSITFLPGCTIVPIVSPSIYFNIYSGRKHTVRSTMAASNTSKATSFESANPFASSKGDHANSGPSAGNAERYHEGKPNSHGPLDSSKCYNMPPIEDANALVEDQRSIANRLANEEVRTFPAIPSAMKNGQPC